MSSTATVKQAKPVIRPIRKMQGHTEAVAGILLLSRRQQIITCSNDGSIRIWGLESGKQVGDSWKDEGSGAMATISLSPDGTTVASGSHDGAVRLWDIDTGKVIRKCTGHTKLVWSVCWSPDGGQVASGSMDHTLRVWDAKSGDTLLRPIEATSNMPVLARYSPDGTMIATSGLQLKIWDANTGELMKKIQGRVVLLAWISNGKTLISYGAGGIIRKLDTATWTETTHLEGHKRIKDFSLSVNERILASVSSEKTARLWDLENDKLIEPPLYHEAMVGCVVFSEDGKFVVAGCDDGRIYTWDVSAIIKKAGLDNLLSDNVNTVNKSSLNADATRRRAPKIEGPRRIPQGFFDNSSPPRGPNTAAPRQSHNPLSWAQNLISGMLRRRDGSNVRLPAIVEVPLTAGKPRNYHARKKPSASSSQPTKPPTTQQQSGGATQSNPSSSQQPPATATASTTPPAVTSTTGVAGTRHDITIRQAGWRARFLLWVCCVPVQQAGG